LTPIRAALRIETAEAEDGSGHPRRQLSLSTLLRSYKENPMPRIPVQFLCLCAVSTLTDLQGEGAGAADFRRRSLTFEANYGQTDGCVDFVARGDGYGLFLTPREAVLVLREGGSDRALCLRWEETRAGSRVSGEGELPGRSHYFLGHNPARWPIGVPSYRRIRYAGLYPGVDLVFHGSPWQLEHDFELAPGAHPGSIRLAIEGEDRMVIDGAGDVVLQLGDRELRLRKPVSSQEVDGVRWEVAGGWRQTGESRLGFDLADRDSARCEPLAASVQA
jgi:hypothetical protein